MSKTKVAVIAFLIGGVLMGGAVAYHMNAKAREAAAIQDYFARLARSRTEPSPTPPDGMTQMLYDVLKMQTVEASPLFNWVPLAIERHTLRIARELKASGIDDPPGAYLRGFLNEYERAHILGWRGETPPDRPEYLMTVESYRDARLAGKEYSEAVRIGMDKGFEAAWKRDHGGNPPREP